MSSSLMWDRPFETVFRSAADLGYAGVEVWAEQWYRSSPRVPEISRIRTGLGLDVSVHASSWDLNLCALNEGIRSRSRDELARSLDLAHELGARVMVVHPGRITISQTDIEDHWSWSTEALVELVDRAGSAGVAIALENMEPIAREFICTPDDLRRLHSSVKRDRLGTTFDLAHVAPAASLRSYWERLPNILHLHLSDARGGLLHLPLGSGDRGVRAALEELIWPAFEGTAVVEGYERGDVCSLAARNKAVYDEWRSAYEERAEGVA